MTAELKRYPEMKDSAVPWLGAVPAHWPLQRLKVLVREISEKGFPEKPLLAATQSMGVVRKDRFPGRTVMAQGDLGLLKLVKVGDFVVSLRSFEGGIETAHDEGIISPAYTVLRAVCADDRLYLARLFKSEPFLGAIRLAVTGIREGQNVDYGRLRDERVCLPPAGERAAIATFLDHADGRIRRSIAAKQKMLRLLEEQKAATLQQAVTRGLNPHAPMKPSGTKWLGDVPAHWPVVPLRRLYRAVFRTDVIGDEPKMSLSRSRGFIRSEDLATRAALSASNVAMSVCVPGDLVMNKYQAQAGLFGSAKQRGLITANYTVFRPLRELNTDYFRLLLASRTYNDIFSVASRGVGDGMTPLYNSAFYATNVPEPPLEEQSAIVRFVERQVAAIDHTISTAKREIELLQEHRTRLVADVVTGKLDVREAAARLPDIRPEEVSTIELASADEETEIIEAEAEFA